MVRYCEPRRHRLSPGETPLVHGLVLEKLHQLYADRADVLMAEEFFRILFRMDHNRPGRPAYPEPFTWGVLRTYLEAEGLPEERGTEPGEEARGFAPRGAHTIGHAWTASSNQNPTTDVLGQSHTLKTTMDQVEEEES